MSFWGLFLNFGLSWDGLGRSVKVMEIFGDPVVFDVWRMLGEGGFLGL